MASGILGIGVSGLQAAQLGLQTAEHNITNANTPGFTRQRTIQASNFATPTSAGFIGQGAHVTTIERMYNGYLSAQVSRAQTTASELDSYYVQIKQIDNMLGDPNAGMSPAIQEFFHGVQQVAANPSLLPARQSMVSSAQALTARFQGMFEQFNQMYAGVNGQIASTVSDINSYAGQIAHINETIVIAQTGLGQPANDLLDQRDQLIAELNKLIRVSTTTNTDGTVNVYVGSGQQLVTNNKAVVMTAAPSNEDATRFTIGMQTAGAVVEMPESLITGGSLAGLLRFRSESLDRVANDIGRNAASFALVFNAQNALGQDLLGQSNGDANFVGDFFTVPVPTVIGSSRNSSPTTVPPNATPAVLSAALVSPPPIDGSYSLDLDGAGTLYTLTRQSDGQQWTGATLAALQGVVPASEGLTLTGAVVAAGASTQVLSPAASGASFYTKLTNSDYRLAYDGANYTVTRLSDSQQWSNASLVALSSTISGSEGFSLSLASGAMLSGDSFLVQPTRSASRYIDVNAAVAADPRLLAAAMPVRTAVGSSNTGTGKISAGETRPGIGAPPIPAGGVSIVFTNGLPPTLTFTGVPAGANISVTVGNTSTVYDPALPIPYTSGAQISFAGVSFQLTGNLNNGDTFSVGRNPSAVSDGRNALALGKLQTQNTMSGKTATFQAAYAQLVSENGNKTRQLQVTGEAQQALLKHSEAARDSLSGVNLDEEAANLIRYQQAYQASAKVLDLGSKLFDTLLAISN